MNNKDLFEKSVIEKLIDLNSDIIGKGSCIAWTTFPFSKKNLDTVKRSVKKLNWKKEEYYIKFDEDFIFVEKSMLQAFISFITLFDI